MPNPVATELRARVTASPDGATGLWIGFDEIGAIADVLDHQDGRIAQLVTGIEQANALTRADEVMAHRMIAVIKMARHFAMRPLELPGGQAVREWLADYIDRGDWGPLPWPDGIPAAITALSALGYIRVGGFAERPLISKPVIEKEKEID